ncbi:flagellar biosynthetic protein FliQ [Shimia sp. R9_1]|uniref:flagellar biosynthetic protein FliQ n=1 Tax=unclassified Shimia TaxID=2630038 RepID=UPI001ADB3C7B|nr:MULTISPECIES: flagellar biosynthetic protein FliQ [unclassified Shimia]MBO9395414.1 flagellar biosynthetic protein FliQ [Shimia sp. R9_2]MBO9399527.1 flagellar biosynthetic protein FliQ [Shimia sp. R9_3]MBO9407418.1 flagellar biosynthetic protein FliQ [Shimia sp. R9_1]
MLEQAIFFDTLRQGLWVAVLISTPILAVALISGVAVGLFQALTSIQEMTLTFVPKVLCIVIIFWATMGFMVQTLVSFFQSNIIPLVVGG